MPLYDFCCRACQHEFERILPRPTSEAGVCPKCGKNELARKVARFRVGGRGDLRESTLHGCHSWDDPHHDHSAHGHDDGEAE